MKYRLLKSEKFPAPPGEKKIIYIIPLSSSQKQYAVIYPAIHPGSLLKSLEEKKLELRKFLGCPEETVNNVKKAIQDMIHTDLKESSSKQSTLFFSGILLIVFGIINFVLPDPLILLDEVLMLLGGIWVLGGGIKLRKTYKALKINQENLELKIKAIPVTEDPITSGIFASIQAKDEHIVKQIKKDFSIDTIKDRIEVETEWYVDYINIEELIQNNQAKKEEVKTFMKGINCIIPLKKVVCLEKKINKKMLKGEKTLSLTRALNSLQRKISKKSGFSIDAIIVYSEFYKSALSWFQSRGEDL
jgi:hypothetical protein